MISSNANLLQLLKSLWGHISPRLQYQAGLLLLLLMVLVALSEILSVGAVISFLGVLTNPQYIFDNNLFRLVSSIRLSKLTHLLETNKIFAEKDKELLRSKISHVFWNSPGIIKDIKSDVLSLSASALKQNNSAQYYKEIINLSKILIENENENEHEHENE